MTAGVPAERGAPAFQPAPTPSRKVTRPEATSYIAPTIPISPLMIMDFSTGLLSSIQRMVLRTLSAATLSTKSGLLASRRSLVLVSMRTASEMGSVIEGRLVSPVASTVSRPFATRSQVAFTAPQRVWPSTTISFAPATLHANSMLPSAFGLATLPARRTLKMSPRPRSKRSSAGERLSMQLRMQAIGCWPSAVESTCCARSRVRRWPEVKRSLPSFRSCSTRSGVSDAWISLVVQSTYCLTSRIG